jgi:hypothetical protein
MSWRSFLEPVRRKQTRILQSLAQPDQPDHGPFSKGLPTSYLVTVVSFWNQKNAKRCMELLAEAKIRARIIRDRGRYAVQIRKDQFEEGLSLYKQHQATFVDRPRTSNRQFWDLVILLSFIVVIALAVAIFLAPQATLSYGALALSWVFPMGLLLYHGMRFRNCRMLEIPFRFHLIDLITLTGTIAISIALHKFGLSI